MTTRTRLRAVRGLCALTAGVCVLVVSGASPAHAASYRYWTYWQATAGAQDWTFASQGPGTFVPADGAVEGWRYAITTQAASTPPDPAPDFSSVCRSTPEQAHRKRVALVVDSGPTGIGPAGEDAPALLTACVVADVDATGYAILSSIVDVRTEIGRAHV